MKKVMMAMTMMFALGCFGQTSGGSPSNGSMGSGQSDSSGSMSGSQSGAMDNGSMNNGMKGEKTLKGCIQSQNGGYMLEKKGGKMAMLTSSQDLSAHVGHMVKVHGMWQNSSMNSGSSMNSNTSMSSDSSNGRAGSRGGNMSQSSMNNSAMGKMDRNGQTFMVNKLDIISDQCKMDKSMSH